MIRPSIILLLAFVLIALLRKRSAAEKNFFFAVAICLAALSPLLSAWLPSWEPALAQRVVSVVEAGSQPFRLVISVNVPSSPLGSFSLSDLLWMMWLTGSFIGFVVIAGGVLRLRRMAEDASPIFDRRWTTLVAELAKELQLNRNVRILQNRQKTMPLTWGFLRPVILLPAGALEWSEDHIRVVLAHELAHIRRRDSFVQCLAAIVRAFYWFNPLFWIACSRLNDESERACDDTVLSLGIDGQDYASRLLEIAREVTHSDRVGAAALAIARPSSLESRFIAMLNSSLNRRALTVRTAAVAVIGMVVIVIPLSAMRTPNVQQGLKTIQPVWVGDVPSESPKAVESAASLAPPTPVPQHVRIGSDNSVPNTAMMPPTLLQSTPPLYTTEALERGLEGVVTLEARVDVNGNLDILRVVDGLGSGLDENAIAAAKDWKFSPARRNGVPVEAISQIDVQFNLRNRGAFRVGAGVSPPRILTRVEPQYTQEARGLRISGTVVLEAIVRKDGTVDVLRVIRSIDQADDYGLTESAVVAMKQWRFEPGRNLAGEPVDVSLNIEINFNLK